MSLLISPESDEPKFSIRHISMVGITDNCCVSTQRSDSLNKRPKCRTIIDPDVQSENG